MMDDPIHIFARLFDLNSFIGLAHKEPEQIARIEASAHAERDMLTILPAILRSVHFPNSCRLNGERERNEIARRRAALVSRVDLPEGMEIHHFRSRGPASTGCNISKGSNKPGKPEHSSSSKSWVPASPANSCTSTSTLSSSLSTADTMITADGSPSPVRALYSEEYSSRKQFCQKEGSGGIRRSTVLLTDRQRCKLGLSKGSRVEDEGLLM